jgi:hypothetical protein
MRLRPGHRPARCPRLWRRVAATLCACRKSGYPRGHKAAPLLLIFTGSLNPATVIRA